MARREDRERPRRPSGREPRAEGRGRPPGRSGGGARKPPIPEDAPKLPRGVWRDIDAATPAGLGPEVARAVSSAGELADEEPDRAAALLAWAKDIAPRSAAVREAIGVAAYRRGDFAVAATELGTYRRLSGRQDQNHLLADSLRATGRGDRVRELVEAMGGEVDEERRVEALLVYAGTLVDRGDALRAREVLERGTPSEEAIGAHHLRLWYFAAELSLEVGDRARAAELWEAVVTVDPEFLDAAEQLESVASEET